MPERDTPDRTLGRRAIPSDRQWGPDSLYSNSNFVSRCGKAVVRMMRVGAVAMTLLGFSLGLGIGPLIARAAQPKPAATATLIEPKRSHQ